MTRAQLLDNRTIQTIFAKSGVYSGKVDGIWGPKSESAAFQVVAALGSFTKNWNAARKLLAVNQWALSKLGFSPGGIDGLWGPDTQDALERYQNTIRDREPPKSTIEHMSTRWPRESEVHDFYGQVGKHQVRMELPYQMRIAWDIGTKVKSIMCHEKVAGSLQAIFKKTLDEYGEARVTELGLDLFGGCLNVRAKRGGRSYSMHSWGIAVDLDPANNGFRWGKDRARLAKDEYDPFWDIVEGEGWISLGREKNYDWMHFQAARF